MQRQAQAGLGAGKNGQPVTLHGTPQTRAIWETAEPQADGSVDFPSPLARLLSQYGADELRGSFLEEFEREVAQILEAEVQVVEP